MFLLMQRLLKDMDEVEHIDCAEPQTDPGPDEKWLTQCPVAIREIMAVLQLRTGELKKEIYWQMTGSSSIEPEAVNRLARYVEFVKDALTHEMGELVPEVDDWQKKGARVTIHRKWAIYVLEGAGPVKRGEMTDAVAEAIAEHVLEIVKNEDRDPDEPPQPTYEPPDPNFDDVVPPDLDDIPGAWGDDPGADLSHQMEQLGWFDKASNIVQSGQNNEGDE